MEDEIRRELAWIRLCERTGDAGLVCCAFGLLTPFLGLCAMTAYAVADIPITRVQRLFHVMMMPILVVVFLCALPLDCSRPSPAACARMAS